MSEPAGRTDVVSGDLAGDDVRRRLGLPDSAAIPFAELERSTPVRPASLPPDAEADALLARLGLAERDRAEMLQVRPDPHRDQDPWWLLERAVEQLRAGTGEVGMLRWPSLPDEHGALGRYFYAWVFLAALPDIRAHHAERGVSDELSWEILADLGLQMAVRRQIYGEGGLHTQAWMTLHFRGAIYSFGRLQFERARIWFDVDSRPGAPMKDDLVLGVHIPETGPMDPAACDESYARAATFYAETYPDEAYRFATCGSWLLDGQLADYLPERSNIIRFQRRFELLPGEHDGDDAVMEFVFRKVGLDLTDPAVLDGLPQNSTLQRALVDHVRAGKHWQVRTGWHPL